MNDIKNLTHKNAHYMHAPLFPRVSFHVTRSFENFAPLHFRFFRLTLMWRYEPIASTFVNCNWNSIKKEKKKWKHHTCSNRRKCLASPLKPPPALPHIGCVLFKHGNITETPSINKFINILQKNNFFAVVVILLVFGLISL